MDLGEVLTADDLGGLPMQLKGVVLRNMSVIL